MPYKSYQNQQRAISVQTLWSIIPLRYSLHPLPKEATSMVLTGFPGEHREQASPGWGEGGRPQQDLHAGA